MIAVVCVENRLGMLFNHRRVSRDRAVTEDVLRLAKTSRLYITPFSAALFAGNAAGVQPVVAETLPPNTAADDICFIENPPLSPYLASGDRVVVYRWNRDYPSDRRLDLALEDESAFLKTGTAEFAGFSHEKITKDCYIKK